LVSLGILAFFISFFPFWLIKGLEYSQPFGKSGNFSTFVILAVLSLQEFMENHKKILSPTSWSLLRVNSLLNLFRPTKPNPHLGTSYRYWNVFE